MKLQLDHHIALVPINLDFAHHIFQHFDERIIEFLPIDTVSNK